MIQSKETIGKLESLMAGCESLFIAQGISEALANQIIDFFKTDTGYSEMQRSKEYVFNRSLLVSSAVRSSVY